MLRRKLPSPLPWRRALKLGPQKLSEATDSSEAGMDQACQLYVVAKRLETGNKLAARDNQQVADLDSWRRPITRCAEGFCELAYGIAGGGTLYSHAANRSVADVEDFLATFSKGLPFQDGKGDQAPGEKLDRLISYVGKLGCPGDTEAEIAKAFKDQRTEQVAVLKELKTLCRYAATQEKQAIDFVVKGASWIDFPESEKK